MDLEHPLMYKSSTVSPSKAMHTTHITVTVMDVKSGASYLCYDTHFTVWVVCMGWRLKLMLQLFFYLQIQPLVVWPALFPEQTPGQTAGLTFNPFGTDRVILKLQLIWGSPWDDNNMHYSCVLYVSQGEYLGVSVEHFDSLGGDEEIHLCHGLRLTLGGLFTHTHTHTHTDTHTHNPTKHY